MVEIIGEITFTREEVCYLLSCDPAYQTKETFTWDEICSLLNSNQ